MRAMKSANSSSAAALPPWTFSAARLVLTKPSRPSVGRPRSTPAGAGARLAAWRSTGYGFRKKSSSFASHAALYGVNTLYGLPLPVSTSLRSKTTWSFDVCKATPQVGERAADARVARQRVRVVVVVGVDRLHVQRRGEVDDLVGALAVAHEQADARHAVACAEAREIGGERVDALDDELDAPVGARQRVEDRAVVDECAPDLARCLERVVERGVVGRAQVAAEPDQGAVDLLFHGPSVPKGRTRRSVERGAGAPE